MAFGLDPCLLALSACRINRGANWWFEGSMPAVWFMVILLAVPAIWFGMRCGLFSRGVCFWCFAIRFELSRGTVGKIVEFEHE